MNTVTRAELLEETGNQETLLQMIEQDMGLVYPLDWNTAENVVGIAIAGRKPVLDDCTYAEDEGLVEFGTSLTWEEEEAMRYNSIDMRVGDDSIAYEAVICWDQYENNYQTTSIFNNVDDAINKVMGMDTEYSDGVTIYGLNSKELIKRKEDLLATLDTLNTVLEM